MNNFVNNFAKNVDGPPQMSRAHPSGDPAPSEADIRLTRRLAEGARILQINMLDHVIIGRAFGGQPGYFSLKEAGLL